MSGNVSEDRDIVCRELASKAKELVSGMQTRVARNPDIADFVAAFTPILKAAAMEKVAGESALAAKNGKKK